MNRSPQLFEFLSRREQASPRPEPTRRTSARRPERRAARAVRKRASASRRTPRPETGERWPAVDWDRPIVLSLPRAGLIGVLLMLMVVLAYFIGVQQGRSGGDRVPPAASTLATRTPDTPSRSDERSVPVTPSAVGDGASYSVRVVTYKYSPESVRTATEVCRFLESRGIREAFPRIGPEDKEIRVYAGRYASPEDPALLEIASKLRAYPGDERWGEAPFRSALIQKLPPIR